jgi:two-component system response regulator LytT
MEWKAIVADDEAPAREELAYLLQQIEGVTDIELAKDGMELIKLVREKQPDIVFLDIEMPGLNGLQTAELISELGYRPKIVFCTAFDQYALEAFKVRAFHYILKPYDEDEIHAIFRELETYEHHEFRKPPAEKRALACGAVKLGIEINGCIKYLSPTEIVYISKEGKHALVHAKDKAYESGYTLQELEEKLAAFPFFRCHKSYLVNLDYAVELRAWINGAYNLIMDDSSGSSVPVSRNYIKELRLRLEI